MFEIVVCGGPNHGKILRADGGFDNPSPVYKFYDLADAQEFIHNCNLNLNLVINEVNGDIYDCSP